MIHFETVDVPIPAYISRLHSIWIEAIIAHFKKKTGEVFFLFCSDAYLHKINLGFLNHDTLTDIITFDLSENTEFVQCEIYISTERVGENAAAIGHTFADELDRVLCHGILHLLGFRDKSEFEISEMRKMEDFCLSIRPYDLTIN